MSDHDSASCAASDSDEFRTSRVSSDDCNAGGDDGCDGVAPCISVSPFFYSPLTAGAADAEQPRAEQAELSAAQQRATQGAR
eukprot:scaffold48594_cov219-Isochrysis_galbana.AAC.1